MAGFNMEDYVDVASRIAIFREKYPNGSLQTEMVCYGPEVVIVKAFAYRTPDDIRPGIGHASEVLPGTTPYTRNSELMVCETSAWGRAIVAVLAADTKKGIASKDEVVRAEAVKAAPKAQPKNNGKKPAAEVTAPVATSNVVAIKDDNKATQDQWARLVIKYGSQAAAVVAARKVFDDAVTSASDLTFLQAEVLLEEGAA